MHEEPPLPETRVLAIASHVSYGYVGNKMATFVMQYLGCDVSAINTVNFSNHTAYKSWRGTKTRAEEIAELYAGLKENHLDDFEMMLSGYTSSKEAVEVLGNIGRELRLKAKDRPGSFFWILDPVMGDEGRLYVAPEIVPAYKSLLPDADLILPNCFEAELLADTEITDMPSLVTAIETLHKTYRIPNIIVTSVHLSTRDGRRKSDSSTLKVVGSTCRADFTPRIFSITVPSIPVFFSGTGDMFAALILSRLREAVFLHPSSGTAAASGSISNHTALYDPADLRNTRSWQPPDHIEATGLPLAHAAERALQSMQAILLATDAARHDELGEEIIREGGSEEDKRLMHLRRTRASEVRVVRHAAMLRDVPVEMFVEERARGMFVAREVEGFLPEEGDGDAGEKMEVYA